MKIIKSRVFTPKASIMNKCSKSLKMSKNHQNHRFWGILWILVFFFEKEDSSKSWVIAHDIAEIWNIEIDTKKHEKWQKIDDFHHFDSFDVSFAIFISFQIEWIERFMILRWNISFICLRAEGSSKMELATTRKQSKFEQACENEASSRASLLPKLKNESLAAGRPIGRNKTASWVKLLSLINTEWCSWGLQAEPGWRAALSDPAAILMKISNLLRYFIYNERNLMKMEQIIASAYPLRDLNDMKSHEIEWFHWFSWNSWANLRI